jgi:hypothetical protein
VLRRGGPRSGLALRLAVALLPLPDDHSLRLVRCPWATQHYRSPTHHASSTAHLTTVVAFERNGTAPPPSGRWERCQFTFTDGENEPVSVSVQETSDPARDPHILAKGSFRGSDYKRYFGVMSGDAIPDSEVVSFVLFALPELNTASPHFTVGVKGRPAPATVRMLDDFTTGHASYCVPPATMETRFHRDSMLGGVRCTSLNNAVSPPGKEVCLSVGSADRLNLMQEPSSSAHSLSGMGCGKMGCIRSN